MFCYKCGRQFLNIEIFCRRCGTLKRQEQESVLCSSADQRSAIRHYFERGFRYETIVHFLAKYHGTSMNVRTLKRRLSEYGLQRRKQVHSEHAVWEIIKREIEGPSSLLGYRGMWNKLRTTYNVTVPRDMVMRILREMDPDASALRKARKLQRRSYVSPGPNAACSCLQNISMFKNCLPHLWQNMIDRTILNSALSWHFGFKMAAMSPSL